MRLFYTREGMAQRRHSQVTDFQPTMELRIDADLVERVTVAKARLHTAGMLPAWQRYKEPADAIPDCD